MKKKNVLIITNCSKVLAFVLCMFDKKGLIQKFFNSNRHWIKFIASSYSFVAERRRKGEGYEKFEESLFVSFR